MTTVLIVVHLMVVLALIGLVLLQRSEGGALGIGGGGGGFMTGRGAGNVLTTSTAVLAAVFFLTSIGLALLAKIESRPSDILERLPSQAPAATETETPAPPAPGGTSPSVEDVLEQLRNPPAGAETPPAAGEGNTAAPTAEAPVPAAEEPAPPSGETAPGPQIPPAGSGTQ
jgi:preprotein translocase subunit SecG